MIKPEDISDCMRLYFEQLRDSDGSLIAEKQVVWMTNPQLADVANFLIASGIVSPPVWVARSTVSGKLLNQTSRKFIKTDGGESIKYEHWKGQTE